MAARCVGDTTLSTASILLLALRARARDARARRRRPSCGSSRAEGARGLRPRGVAYYAFLMTWYLSVDYLPLGDAIALNYSSPAVIAPPPRRARRARAGTSRCSSASSSRGVLLLAQPAGLFGGASEPLAARRVPAAVSVGAIAVVTVRAASRGPRARLPLSGIKLRNLHQLPPPFPIPRCSRGSRAARTCCTAAGAGAVAALVPLSLGVAALCPRAEPAVGRAGAVRRARRAARVRGHGVLEARERPRQDRGGGSLPSWPRCRRHVPAARRRGERLDALDWLGCGLILAASAPTLGAARWRLRGRAAARAERDSSRGLRRGRGRAQAARAAAAAGIWLRSSLRAATTRITTAGFLARHRHTRPPRDPLTARGRGATCARAPPPRTPDARARHCGSSSPSPPPDVLAQSVRAREPPPPHSLPFPFPTLPYFFLSMMVSWL